MQQITAMSCCLHPSTACLTLSRTRVSLPSFPTLPLLMPAAASTTLLATTSTDGAVVSSTMPMTFVKCACKSASPLPSFPSCHIPCLEKEGASVCASSTELPTPTRHDPAIPPSYVLLCSPFPLQLWLHPRGCGCAQSCLLYATARCAAAAWWCGLGGRRHSGHVQPVLQGPSHWQDQADGEGPGSANAGPPRQALPTAPLGRTGGHSWHCGANHTGKDIKVAVPALGCVCV